MTDILTITLNPALDIATTCDVLEPSHKLRCARAEYFPGGGGINVARVIHRLGGDCVALYLAGGVVGQRLQSLLDDEQVPQHLLPIRNETRESFSVLENSTGKEYRFVLPGPQVSKAEWQTCLDYVGTCDPAPRLVVLSGSLPPELPSNSYARLAEAARIRGSQVVVDSSGAALKAALEAGVYLIKPSLRELSELTGRPLETEAQWCAAARSLVRNGSTEIVALSLGEQGALLVTVDGAWRAAPLHVDVKSTTGAGDSFLAAMVWALASAATPLDAFRHGVAAGSSALLRTGTQLCQPADLAAMLHDVKIRAV